MIPEPSLEKLKDRSPVLAQIFIDHWEQTLFKYSEKLYVAQKASLEPELASAFREEWSSMDIASERIEQAIGQLSELPVLQTSHHITPTNGPGFLSLDLITLSGLPKGALYLVAANSGVAFSNTAWTGAFSYGSTELKSILQEGSSSYHQSLKSAKERREHGDGDQRITLIPARQRDQLVFGTTIEANHRKVIPDLTSRLSPLMEPMSLGGLYSHWAAKSSNLIQNQLFNTDCILYFDVNQVIKRYLLRVLDNPDHPVFQLIFERKDIWTHFGYPTVFLKNYKGKKSNKVDSLIWSPQGLYSRKTGPHSSGPGEIIEALENNCYCPAVFLLFFILRFLNGIKCLGSFNQIEYMERFRQGWLKTETDWNLDLTEDWHQSLTTGRLIKKGTDQWSLDYYLRKETINVQDYNQVPMGQFWAPILTRLTD